MKDRKFIFLPLVVFVLIVAGCAGSEEITNGEHGSDSNVTYATARQGAGASTRISYEDGDIMKVAWSANDAFSVFAGSELKTFIIVPPANGIYTANETFKCNDFTSTDGLKIDAIYPMLPNDGTTYNPYHLELDLTIQTQYGNGSTAHLAAKDYVVGHATYHEGKNVDFDFTDSGSANSGRLSGMLRLIITFPAEVSKVSSITVSTKDGTLNTKALVNLVGNTSVVYGNPQAITLTVNNGTVEADKRFKAFVMVFPSDISSDINGTVVTNAGNYAYSFHPAKPIVLERGKRNTVTLDLTTATPDRTSLTDYNAVGSGTAADPYLLYTEAQLQDWATQNNAGNIVVKTNSRAATAYAHFKLANDITLTAPADGGSNWTPIGTDANPFVGTFDGNNKTLSAMTVKTTNTTYAGFIGRMTGGELKNLTVKGTVTADNTGTGNTNKIFAAGLVASMEGGTLSGTLTSDVAVTAKGNASVYAGGLVGAKKPEVVTTGATLSATGAVTATVSATGTVAGSEIGAGSIIGNGTKDENTATGAGTVTVTAPDGTTIVNNGVSNKVNPGDVTTNPWEPNGGSDLETK